MICPGVYTGPAWRCRAIRFSPNIMRAQLCGSQKKLDLDGIEQKDEIANAEYRTPIEDHSEQRSADSPPS